MFNPQDAKLTGYLHVRGHTNGLAYSPTGEQIAIADQEENVLKVWTPLTDHIERYEIAGLATAVSWAGDDRLAIGSESPEGTRITTFDASGQPERAIDNPHDGHLLAVDWHPDGSRIVSIGSDNRLCVYDSKSGILLWDERRPILSSA